MNYYLETEDDYRLALHRFIELSQKTKNEEERQEMLMLIKLMDRYEQQNSPFH